ncbi:helix-turn-helix domain-containing protein [Ideonella paludis]|uniref:Helix-turn-helix domain-containing protein n=2 Tax=Ideonella paludis TaxID=1233411 RepID=A0ABS5DT18_9BURK|nr:helix-turn-helix domain-containing protein [Ideonella paludis]
MAESGSNRYDSNMSRLTDAVRHYGLYGEVDAAPDVMHCETIAERSVLHAWELAPHRHARLHQVLLLSQGGGMARLDDAEQALAPGTVVNVPVGVVHAFTFEPGSDGWVVTLADTTVDELLKGEPEVRRALATPWAGVADTPLRLTFEQLAAEFSSTHAARALVLRGQCATLLGQASRAVAATAGHSTNPSESNLLQRFEALLEAHFKEHWRVNDYAHALAVSPTHLSRVVRAATGAPASHLIDARIVREARRQLAFTHLQVASIAYTLGYQDPSLFSRVFARVTGRSPREYRRQVAGQ